MRRELIDEGGTLAPRRLGTARSWSDAAVAGDPAGAVLVAAIAQAPGGARTLIVSRRAGARWQSFRVAGGAASIDFNMNPSTLQGVSATVGPGSALRPSASTQPADPAPTTTAS